MRPPPPQYSRADALDHFTSPIRDVPFSDPPGLLVRAIACGVAGAVWCLAVVFYVLFLVLDRRLMVVNIVNPAWDDVQGHTNNSIHCTCEVPPTLSRGPPL